MQSREQSFQHIYRFGGGQAEGDGGMREELGGKGAGLAEMTRLGIPVPPGFTISTQVCRFVLQHGRTPDGFAGELEAALAWLEAQQGQNFGDAENPLLVSVRSGAAVSMPGMMDTILNVGLNDASVCGLAARHGNERFALDSYRRLLQMFGAVVLQTPKAHFDAALAAVKQGRNLQSDAELDASALRECITRYKEVIEQDAGVPFPMDTRGQLRMAIEAVFHSWRNERAQYYRRIHSIAEDSGTAVTVQAMVFGNYGQDSGTGVGFTRNPSTGKKELFGEFLADAQGEDIVAGTRTPVPVVQLHRTMPRVYDQLHTVTTRLEKHYGNVQDFEFTVQHGELFLLQTRSAKRSALATVRTAVDMMEEGLISREEALQRVSPKAIDEMLSPQLDLTGLALQPIAKGLAASPGSAVGQLTLSADRAIALAGSRRENPIILVRHETTADDIHGMDASVGFLTAHGGATSHAAVVARGMGKCCITGASGIEVDERAGVVEIGGSIFREGDWLSLDGSTGRVFAGKLPLRTADVLDPSLAKVLGWTRKLAGSSVRANADTPHDAVRARSHGACGIGLCRTEHMFFAPERLPHVRSMILASTREERQQALDALLPMQEADFRELFRAMSGLPVTIRLIDPPLHEFLPSVADVEAELAQLRRTDESGEAVSRLQAVRNRIQQLAETNPMLGHRGCRLGITYPEIIAMQVKAILSAALDARTEGNEPVPEIMVPLVACLEEMRFLRKVIDSAAAELFSERGTTVHYRVGVMIELPRAAVCAGSIAEEVDFLSFGTNDLTQMTFGFSRDDARKYLDTYLELGILKDDPFLTLDQEGVGALIRSAVRDARLAKPGIKIGVCGEHGGDPASIAFFHSLGMDYVSCSPARLPAALLAMAQLQSSSPAEELQELMTMAAA